MTLAGVERGNVHRLIEMDTFILLQPLRATVSYPLFLALEPAVIPTPACQSAQGGWYYYFTGLKKVQVAKVEPMQVWFILIPGAFIPDNLPISA